jgi:transcriptional regulator with XRE-family HTH domain
VIPETLGERIKKYLPPSGLTKIGLANALGVTLKRVESFIKNETTPTPDEKQRMAELLVGGNYDFLVHGKNTSVPRLSQEATLESSAESNDDAEETDKSKLDGFAVRLKIARGTRSQKYVAHALGIRQQAYARYESGKVTPSVYMLVRICRELGASADWLLGLK